MLLVSLLLALTPAVQERTPVEASPVTAAVVILDSFSLEPIADFRMEAVQYGDSTIRESCETDAKGRVFLTEAFLPGRISFKFDDNRVGELNSRFTDSQAAVWDGESLMTLQICGGMRFDFELPEQEFSAEQLSDLRVYMAPVSVSELQDTWRHDYAVVRPVPGRNGRAMARFASVANPAGSKFSSWEKRQTKATGLVVCSLDGHWFAEVALPQNGEAISLHMEPRASIRMSAREYSPGEVDPAGPFTNVWASLRQVNEDGLAEASRTSGVRIPLGGSAQVKWLELGAWEVKTSALYFPETSQRVQLVAGPNTCPEIVVGERTPVADIRIIVRDFDGDIVLDSGDSASSPESRSWRGGRGLLPEVLLEREGSYLSLEAPSFAMCGVGINYWCTLKEQDGKRWREAVFDNLLDAEFTATVDVEERRVEPRFLKLRPGDVGEFTLMPIDKNTGYWIEATREDARATGFLFGTRYEGGQEVEFEGRLGTPLLASFERPENGLGEWAATSYGFKAQYLDESSFFPDGERFVASVAFNPGWACRYRLVDEKGHPLTGITVTWEGRTHVSDDQGRVTLESDLPYPIGLPTFGGLESVAPLGNGTNLTTSRPYGVIGLKRAVTPE